MACTSPQILRTTLSGKVRTCNKTFCLRGRSRSDTVSTYLLRQSQLLALATAFGLRSLREIAFLSRRSRFDYEVRCTSGTPIPSQRVGRPIKSRRSDPQNLTNRLNARSRKPGFHSPRRDFRGNYTLDRSDLEGRGGSDRWDGTVTDLRRMPPGQCFRINLSFGGQTKAGLRPPIHRPRIPPGCCHAGSARSLHSSLHLPCSALAKRCRVAPNVRRISSAV